MQHPRLSRALRSAGAALPLLVLASALLLAGAALAAPAWTDVAAEAGITFRHSGEGNDAPPAMYVGGGVCFADFDGDGFDDLFFVNSRHNNSSLEALYRPISRIYQNNGDGTFTDRTAGSGAGVSAFAQGCSVADYDADGDLDLFVSAHSVSTLLRNDGPFRFTNVTDEAGVNLEHKCEPHKCFSTGSAWTDYNGDGCLDLYVVNYGNVSVDSPHQPTSWPGQANVFFANNCDGTFTDRTLETNLDDDPSEDHSRSFQPMWSDFDGDGLPDVFITADGAPDSLLRAMGDGTFADVARAAGVDDPRAGMGLEFQDVNGDAWPDLYFTHYKGEHNGFYVNDQDGKFLDHSGEGDLATDLPYVGWGTGFVDFDHDGDKDIYVVNGHTELDLPDTDQERLLYRNDGDLTFVDVTGDHGTGWTDRTNARGSAWSDFDFDGDLDFAVNNNNNQTANLLRGSGAQGAWLLVEVRQPGANWQAVGAVVEVIPSGLHAETRIVHAGASFLSQNSMYQHFGLGDAESATVRVRWPDGSLESWSGIPADRVVRLLRGDSVPVTDTLAPRSAAVLEGERLGEWYMEAPKVTLSATDLGQSTPTGVARIEYRVNGGEIHVYEGPFTFGRGRTVFEHRAVDVAGNAEPWRSLVILIDLEPPTVTAFADRAPDPDGWYAHAPLVTADGMDLSSGLRIIEYHVGDGAWRSYEGPFTPPDGDRTLTFRAIDLPGRESDPFHLPLKVDALPPETTLRIEGPSRDRGDGVLEVDRTTLLVLEAEDLGPGVAATEVRIDGGPWTTYAGPFGIDGRDRDVLLEFRSTDLHAHMEAVKSRRLALEDTRPPEVALLDPAPRSLTTAAGREDLSPARPAYEALAGPAGAPAEGDRVVAGPVPVRGAAGPDVSGIAWIRVLVDGVERARVESPTIEWAWPAHLEIPGFHRLAIEASDGRGNAARTEVDVLVL